MGYEITMAFLVLQRFCRRCILKDGEDKFSPLFAVGGGDGTK
jgi:hypothetical protein